MVPLTARGNWLFTRLRDGSVRIVKQVSVAPGHGFAVEQLFTPAEWVEIISSVAATPTADSVELAIKLHGAT